MSVPEIKAVFLGFFPGMVKNSLDAQLNVFSWLGSGDRFCFSPILICFLLKLLVLWTDSDLIRFVKKHLKHSQIYNSFTVITYDPVLTSLYSFLCIFVAVQTHFF